jgi:hypothetical protein
MVSIDPPHMVEISDYNPSDSAFPFTMAELPDMRRVSTPNGFQVRTRFCFQPALALTFDHTDLLRYPHFFRVG